MLLFPNVNTGESVPCLGEGSRPVGKENNTGCNSVTLGRPHDNLEVDQLSRRPIPGWTLASRRQPRV